MDTTTDTDHVTANLSTARQWLGDLVACLSDQVVRAEAAAHAVRAAGLQLPDVAALLERDARRLADVAAELRGEA